MYDSCMIDALTLLSIKILMYVFLQLTPFCFGLTLLEIVSFEIKVIFILFLLNFLLV